MQTCYMCSKPATSREHVPPKCLFPEKKDVPTGIDYRKNLITVPSCDEHNIEKSADDQALLVITLLNYSNNMVGQAHFGSKLIRTLERNSSVLGILTEKREIILNGQEATGFTINLARFNRLLERIVRALYYAEYGTHWDAPIRLMTPSLFDTTSHNASKVNQMQQEGKEAVNRFLSTAPIKGDNPEVFYYQLYKDLQEKTMITKLVFYNGFFVSAYSFPNMEKWQRSAED